MNYKEAWLDLKERVDRADIEMNKILDDMKESDRAYDRTRGKISGIRLIQDYIRGYAPED
jgi:hypothetical protein